MQRPDSQYVKAWLRRAGRQLAVSGRISQIALVLARESERSEAEWRDTLHDVMQGREIPSMELLTRIDALLASSSASTRPDDQQGSLF